MSDIPLLQVAKARRLAALASIDPDQPNLFATAGGHPPRQTGKRPVAIFTSSRSVTPHPTPRLHVVGGENSIAA